MRKIFAALTFAAITMLAAPALADDYVFAVPVRIENAQMITTASVVCTVVYARGTSPTIADGRTTVVVTDGSYSGTVTVTVTPPPEARRENARTWNCDLNLLLSPTPATTTWLNASLSEEHRRIRYTAATGRAVVSSSLVGRGTF